jgi:chaperonin GroEL
MPKRNLVRNVVPEGKTKEMISRGVDSIYDVAVASYGADSGNVLIEYRYGEPLVSHDGITNVSSLVLSDPVSNAAVSIVRQASEKTNRNAGDATTLTIVLTKLSYDYWKNKKMPLRKLQREIVATSQKMLERIDSGKIECTDDMLKNVSRISAGDKGIGDMVADAVLSVGKRGGITVVETPENIVSTEVINGFSFKKGIRVPALADDLQTLKTNYTNPSIVVLPKLITKNDDVLPIIDKMIRANKTPILLIGDVSGQALETLVANKLKGNVDIAIVEPLANDRDAFMNDIAVYTSTKQYTGRPEDFDVEKYVGTAESVSITTSETIINGGADRDKLDSYVKDIESSERRERLLGKTVRISVGAPTQAERQELKLRIEDAVCAAQTAYEHGVLPGGGVFLRDNDDVAGYFNGPFHILTGEDVSEKQHDKSFGIDIETGENVNMLDAGIIDSAKAIQEAVVNSHSAAAQLLSVKLALPFKEDME